jgi:hypothetical protein
MQAAVEHGHGIGPPTVNFCNRNPLEKSEPVNEERERRRLLLLSCKTAMSR